VVTVLGEAVVFLTLTVERVEHGLAAPTRLGEDLVPVVVEVLTVTLAVEAAVEVTPAVDLSQAKTQGMEELLLMLEATNLIPLVTPVWAMSQLLDCKDTENLNAY
jgi:hypothetical protein